MFIHSQHFNPNVLEFGSIIHSQFTQKVRQLQMYYFKLNIKWLLFKAYYYLNDYLRTFGTIHVASIIMIKEILLKKTLSELYQHSKFLFNIWYLLFDRFDNSIHVSRSTKWWFKNIISNLVQWIYFIQSYWDVQMLNWDVKFIISLYIYLDERKKSFISITHINTCNTSINSKI